MDKIFEICNGNLNRVLIRTPKKIIVPEGVKKIDYRAFSFCLAEEIILPDSLLEINNSAFSDCKELKKIIIPKKVTTIGSCAFSDCIKLEEIEFIGGIESIGSYAFSNTNLKKIFLPKSIKNIGEFAFKNKEMIIYCEDEPTDGWINKIKKEKIYQSYPDPDQEGFNFHRSSGGWSMINVLDYIEEKRLLWCDEDIKVITHISYDEYKKY